MLLFQVLTLKESVNIDHLVSQAGAVTVVTPATAGTTVVVDSAATPAAVAPTSYAALPEAYQMAAPLNEVELTALLMASPLYHKMEKIKKNIANGGVKFGNKMAPGEG